MTRAINILRSLAFYIAFYGGCVWFVLAAFVARYLGEDIFLRACERWSAFHYSCAKWLLGIRVRVEGDLPQSGVLVAMRHESFFEAIDLPRLLDRPAIFAKIELLGIPVWGRLGAAYGLIGVEREGGARTLRTMIVAARGYLAQNRLLMIFPEGTRVPHGETGPIQSGFAAIYKLMGQPVVPISLDSGPLYQGWIKQPGTITYHVGEPIPAGLPRDEIEQRVAAGIRALETK